MPSTTTTVHSGNSANRSEHTYYGNGTGTTARMVHYANNRAVREDVWVNHGNGHTSKTEKDIVTGTTSRRDWYASVSRNP